MDKKMVLIENSDGSTSEVELVTYLYNEEQQLNYIVYSKGEMSGSDGDEVIYISRIVKDGDILVIEEIKEDTEWTKVQSLLKRIANA